MHVADVWVQIPPGLVVGGPSLAQASVPVIFFNFFFAGHFISRFVCFY
jgi:hypothetical protein